MCCSAPWCFTPHKSWIFRQLAQYCILEGGGKDLCLPHPASPEIMMINCPTRTNQVQILQKTLYHVQPDCKHTHTVLSVAYTVQKLNAAVTPSGSNQEFWRVWLTCSGTPDDILKCCLLVNKTSRLVHETRLVTIYDLIDDAVSGDLDCDSLLHIIIGLSGCGQCPFN